MHTSKGKAAASFLPCVRVGARHASPAAGFSLVEAIVFIVIVSVALAGVLSVMNLTTKRSADPLIRKQMIAIGESLLEEISQQNFTNPAVGGYTCAPLPCTQAKRQLLDDIGDYSGFATTGIYPIDTNVLIPGLTGYNVAVTVAGAALGPAANQISSTNANLITVTVTGPDSSTITLSGYRTAYGS
jgi:MSHA pilin protein MshD